MLEASCHLFRPDMSSRHIATVDVFDTKHDTHLHTFL